MVMSNPRAEMPDEAKLVAPSEGDQHGYWGQVPDLEDNETYTAQGRAQAIEQAKKDHAKREAEWAKAGAVEPEKKPPARRSTKKDGE